eukprot:GDKK01022903.1.p1 GENE.GDKK01022903.1~~GDKK01022903.1.p1  ORF type:complete len:389 (+),score=67.98 GDKK01022903.1:28-1194(+)
MGTDTFTYREFQAITLILAFVMLISLGILELIFKKFNVLRECFHMMTFRKKRLFCHDIDITTHPNGRVVRSESKSCIRVTVLMALAYIWTTCVIKQQTFPSSKIPYDECSKGSYCFATKFAFDTLFDGEQPPSCSDFINDPSKVPENSFINCSTPIKPDLILWIQHLAIAYAFSTLCIRMYECLTYASSRSIAFERFLYIVAVCYTVAMLVLFLSGLIASFISSFVALWITFSFPVYFKLGAWAGNHLRELRRSEFIQNQAKAQSAFVSELRSQELILAADENDELTTLQQRATNQHFKERANMRLRLIEEQLRARQAGDEIRYRNEDDDQDDDEDEHEEYAHEHGRVDAAKHKKNDDDNYEASNIKTEDKIVTSSNEQSQTLTDLKK